MRNLLFAGVAGLALILAGSGQTQIIGKQTLLHHEYTAYERKVRDTVVQFHKNFSAHEWAQNGPLVAEDIIVDSNGTELHGRDALVARIARFEGPFPDVRIDDLDTMVDGNVATVKFVITGTQRGDFPTPAGVIKATNKPIRVEGVEVFYFNEAAQVQKLFQIERLDDLVAQLKN